MRLTAEQYADIAKGIAGLAHALDTANLKPFETAVADLVAQINPTLPTKEDGSAFTDDELAAAAQAARQPFLDILARDSQVG